MDHSGTIDSVTLPEVIALPISLLRGDLPLGELPRFLLTLFLQGLFKLTWLFTISVICILIFGPLFAVVLNVPGTAILTGVFTIDHRDIVVAALIGLPAASAMTWLLAD